MKKVAGNFLENELITTFKYKDKEEKYYAKKTKTYTDIPLVILVNGDSASASECLSGALQCHKRATIVGTQTYGKGIGQSTYMCPSGGFVTFTTAKYFLPNGECIHGKGVTPDVIVNLPQEVINGERKLTRENDTQLQEALKILK